ncbi:MAG: hypothetical protein KJO22_01050, partial [Bacteroidia bacterium]|nr:hypothetical protein [Bacteroidia bacterium]
GAGMLSFKLLAIIVNTLTYIVGFYVLKPYIKTQYVIIGLLMALFIYDFGFLVFYHNQLTALLTVTGIYFLIKALREQRSSWFIIAGLVIGINIFARLTNLSLLALIAVIPFFKMISKTSIHVILKSTLQYVLGIGLGATAMVLLIVVLGQWPIFSSALETLTDLGTASDSSHNFSDLISIQFLNYKTILGSFVKFGIITAVLILLSKFLKAKSIGKGIFLITGVVIYGYWLYNQHTIYAIYVLSLIGCLVVVIRKQESSIFRSVALAALLILLVLPLGSAGGVISSGYMAIWLAVPLFFYAILLLSKYKMRSVEYKWPSHIMIVAIVVSFFSIKAYRVFNEAYFDPGSRLEKTASVNSKYLKHVYTTEERAEILNEVLFHLKEVAQPNDYILAYDNIPLIHYLTETKPYLGNPWVWLYDDSSFEKKLDMASQHKDELPVIVAQKFETIIAFSEPKLNYLSTTPHADNESRIYKNKILQQFLISHNYEIVWSNSYFNIYKVNHPAK